MKNSIRIYTKRIFECSCCPHKGYYRGREKRCDKAGLLIPEKDYKPNCVPDRCPLPDESESGERRMSKHGYRIIYTSIFKAKYKPDKRIADIPDMRMAVRIAKLLNSKRKRDKPFYYRVDYIGYDTGENK